MCNVLKRWRKKTPSLTLWRDYYAWCNSDPGWGQQGVPGRVEHLLWCAADKWYAICLITGATLMHTGLGSITCWHLQLRNVPRWFASEANSPPLDICAFCAQHESFSLWWHVCLHLHGSDHVRALPWSPPSTNDDSVSCEQDIFFPD